MEKYNVINIGGEVLNLDGAMDHAAAIELANEIEAEHNIEVKIVEQTYEFETLSDAQDWAHRASLVFDTDEECQEECERLLKTVTIRERDE